MEVPNSEAKIVTVEASYRVRLPQPFCKQVGWIDGDEVLTAWLLVGSAGRCRLLSSAEISSEPELGSLAAVIAANNMAQGTGALEFADEAVVGLNQRLLEIQVTPHKTSGWRLTLPRVIATIMQVSPNKSEVAIMFVHRHIEIWTIEMLRSAANRPLTEII